jgi:HAD superfamily hydrolase (TIGR01509 family)
MRNMPPPEVVVFDLGKVLVDFDYGIAARRLAARSRVPESEVRRAIDSSPLLNRYETGAITRQEFFQEVRALSGFQGSLDEFNHFFADIFTPIEAMIDLQARLAQRPVPTYIFSNTNDLAVDHIRQQFPFFQNFSDYVLSYEHGVMKPDPRLYQVVERITGRTGKKILYLDDRIENAEAGAARGWQVIHHQSAEKTVAAVDQLGLLTDLPS